MSDQAADFDSIAQHCVAIVARARQLPVETVTLESSLEALGVDSLDKVSLSFDLEDAYNIDIPDSALHQVKTVGDIVRGVEGALQRRLTTAGHEPSRATLAGDSGSDEKVTDDADADVSL